MGRKHIPFTEEEDTFIIENIGKYPTLYDLLDVFEERFPQHPISYKGLQKRMALIGVRKGTHNIRKEKVHSRNRVETVIKSAGHGARVKTECGYVPAGRYFKEKYFPNQQGKLVHLNGNGADFSRENLALVSAGIFASLHWRKWIFEDPDLTKTAILAAELLAFFPEYTKHEDQILGLRKHN